MQQAAASEVTTAPPDPWHDIPIRPTGLATLSRRGEWVLPERPGLDSRASTIPLWLGQATIELRYDTVELEEDPDFERARCTAIHELMLASMYGQLSGRTGPTQPAHEEYGAVAVVEAAEFAGEILDRVYAELDDPEFLEAVARKIIARLARDQPGEDLLTLTTRALLSVHVLPADPVRPGPLAATGPEQAAAEGAIKEFLCEAASLFLDEPQIHYGGYSRADLEEAWAASPFFAIPNSSY